MNAAPRASKFHLLGILVFALCCFKTSFCPAQSDADLTARKFSSQDLIYDFNWFRGILERAHPGLYRYIHKDSLDACFEQAKAQLNKPLSELEFWKLLQTIVVKTGSGHTGVSLSEVTRNAYNRQYHYVLPFYVFVMDDRLYIRDFVNLAGYDIGDEVLGIDGHSAKEILKTLRDLIPGDGYSNAFKDHGLETNTFATYFNFVYGELPKHQIILRSDGVVKTKIMSCARMIYGYSRPGPQKNTFSASEAGATGGPPVMPDSLYHRLTYPAGIASTALLKVSGFSYQDYDSFHRHVFKELKKNKTENLILDLRNDPGGLDNVAMDLLTYLSGKKTQFTMYEEGFTDFTRFLNMVNIDHQVDPAQLDHIYYRGKYDMNKELDPDHNHFNGRLFVLINGGTFSAAALLAVAIKSQIDCTIVGSETGGGRYGTEGMQIPLVTLPETHLKLAIPLLWTYSMSNEKNEGCGLKPDVEVIPDGKQMYQYIANHIDPYLLKVKELIGTKPAGN